LASSYFERVVATAGRTSWKSRAHGSVGAELLIASCRSGLFGLFVANLGVEGDWLDTLYKLTALCQQDLLTRMKEVED
jgi:hypothetical protein